MRSLAATLSLCLMAALASAQKGLPPELLAEVLAPDRLPSGTYTRVARWAAAGGASHLTGKAVAGAVGESARVWEARIGVARSGRHMIYGPYLAVEAGTYVAFVRMKALDEAGADSIARLDAATDLGGTERAALEVTGRHLRKGQYVQIPLAFRTEAGKLEVRLLWRGIAGLRVDTITLYRLADGAIVENPLRASPAKPSGRPSNLPLSTEKRPYPDILPRSAPPARTLFVCDLTREAPDVQLAVLALQGLINRRQPVLYCLYNDTDATWLNWMRRQGWVTSTKPVKRWTDLLSGFRSRIKGLVVTDPNVRATRNIGTMVGAVDDLLIVSPRMLTAYAAEFRKADLTVRVDLRGRWTRAAQAYRWALDRLWPRMNHHLAACSSPDHLGLRDYLTQHRAFVFWVSGPIDGAEPEGDPNAEAAVAEELLGRMPQNNPILSYPWAGKDVGMGEGPGVTLFAEFGKYLVGTVDVTNLSVHSGIVVPHLQPRRVQPPKLDERKVYVSFIMSDGDNLPVLTVGNFPQLWASEYRGKTPVGWTLSPAASVVLPGIVQYYYSTATPNDAFLGAVSGVGYTYPDSYGLRYRPEVRAQVFDGFLEQTARYMRRSGLDELWIMNATRPDLIRRYAEQIPGLRALFPDYGKRVADYRSATYPTFGGVPVFHAVTGWTEAAGSEARIAQMVEQIRAITPMERPAFLHVFVLNWGADLAHLSEVMKRLGPGYVAVRPDHLAALYGQELKRRKLLVRAPSKAIGIAGRELEVDFSVQNVTNAPVAVTLQPSAGSSGGSIRPDSLTIPPWETATAVLRGLIRGDTGIIVGGPLGEHRYGLAIELIPAEEVPMDMPGGALKFVGRYEGESLPHNGGGPVSDSAASGVTALRVDRASAQAGCVVFGPYDTLPPGRYVALFRMKGGGGAQGSVDACVGGGVPVTSTRSLSGSEFQSEAYRSVPLVFTHPGGQAETRLHWTGSGWLTLDWVGIWKVIEPSP